jgi:hypothetical protein
MLLSVHDKELVRCSRDPLARWRYAPLSRLSTA